MTVYSAVQFLTLLLIAASVIAVVAARMRLSTDQVLCCYQHLETRNATS